MAANLITVPTVRGNPGRLPRSDLFPHTVLAVVISAHFKFMKESP